MLTDESPATWHSDEYLREWARQRGRVYPITYLPLLGVVPNMIAAIHFQDGGRVDRYQDPAIPEMRRKAPTVAEVQK